MSRFWTLLTHFHSVAGPVLMLLYPLYASVIAIETPSKEDDQQWLAYWIIYSFLTLSEILIQSILEWIPIWYTVKLILAAWLVLPQFRGAAYIYEKFVREHVRKYTGNYPAHKSDVRKYTANHPVHKSPSVNGKGKKKFAQFITPKKAEQEAY
ncbi:hypothetical protein K2173_027671 [Erythroxylum novogranatense]|uniref:HVA22-like protein n=1 Tax=Erythroxylum novogranatense TaxID=1862640 RepID=A0AAV8U2N3_9ROSI|nr:hypothetical protein K2173_027671 [Erythroxylum novogranatense]